MRGARGLRGFSYQAFCFRELAFYNSHFLTYSKMKRKLPSRGVFRGAESPVVVVMWVDWGGGRGLDPKVL